MDEKFSKIKDEKKQIRQTNRIIFGGVGVFAFPIIGTAITETESAANHLTLLSNADFVFSLFLIPLVFFVIYKLDKIVERKVPKRELENEITSGEADVLQR
jgi:hypothetical protein